MPIGDFRGVFLLRVGRGIGLQGSGRDFRAIRVAACVKDSAASSSLLPSSLLVVSGILDSST